MPHVFTLEGPTPGQLAGLSAEPVVTFPPGGSPLAPHVAVIGPTRVATPVFGPGGTPVMYRRRYPARGPVCDYCEQNNFIVMDGGLDVIPPRVQQFGDAVDWLQQRGPLAAGLIVLGGALASGAVLGGYAYWLHKKSGERGARASLGESRHRKWMKVEGEIRDLKKQMGFDPTPAETRKMEALKKKAARLRTD